MWKKRISCAVMELMATELQGALINSREDHYRRKCGPGMENAATGNKQH